MAKSKIKFTRTRDVKLPERGHEHDAGIDFFVPIFDAEFIEYAKKENDILNSEDKTNRLCYSGLSISAGGSSSPAPSLTFELEDPNDSRIKFDDEKGINYFLLPPLSRAKLPSGIYCQMEDSGRALIASNKSGIATKHGVIFGAQVVDFEYQGEIHISVINTSSKTVRIYEGQKLIQFIETPVFTSEIEEVKNIQDLYKAATARADKGFGSTDKKSK